ncbi:MAG: molybdopterin-dependent oxidoreductase [Planctomycetota bacterium]
MTTKTAQTICPLDCPDTCALEVTVSDARIRAIRASRSAAHPITGGFICGKVSHFDRHVYHRDRILHPMRRRGKKGAGEFERITWDEALATIVVRWRELSARHGAETILPYHYGGSNGYLTDGGIDDLLFARLGASRIARTLCAVPATEMAVAMYGKMPGVAFEDYAHSRCIIVWGANPKVSNIHLVPFLHEAKRNGAFIAIVDPRANFSAHEIDLHLPVYPGADLPLALGLIHECQRAGRLHHEFLRRHAIDAEALLAAAAEWPLERAAATARVPLADARRLASIYASATPAVIRIGWGLERNINGAPAIAAILALPALLGKFGVRGGGYTLSNSGAAKLDTKRLFGDVPWTTRTINMTRLGSALSGRGGDMDDVHGDGATPLTPAIHALFVYNANPVATTPDQNAIVHGLEREDLFTVVFEQIMTDTAAYADIVLPATTFLESDEIRRGYGAYVVGAGRPVIDACGEARTNPAVFAALGRALGFTDAAFSWDAETLRQKTLEAIEMTGRPIDIAKLNAEGLVGYDFPGAAPVQFETVLPLTADRKVHLRPAALGAKPFHYHCIESREYPLALISPATGETVSSTLGETGLRELRVALHPDDAAARGIATRDVVRVFNALGEVVCRAEINARVRLGVVMLPKGAWRKSSLNGNISTALCPPHTQLVGGAACYNDARVEVARASAS